MTPRMLVMMFLCILFLQGCQEKPEYPGKYPGNTCLITELLATGRYTDCNIQFKDFSNTFTYIANESSFYTLGAPCNQSVFSVKIINSQHAHNAPDYTFMLKMNYFKKEDFFKPGSIQVNSITLKEEQLTGGSSASYSNVDITLVWEQVTLKGNYYTGNGKIIINKAIAHNSITNYSYPAQEIPFEFN